mgnify:FL=1
MIVNFLNTLKVPKKTREEMKRVMEECLKYLNQTEPTEINIAFVTPEEIREVNKNQRGKDVPTDVLSFPSINLKVGEIIDLTNMDHKFNINPENDAFSLGDMLLCIDVAKAQAKEFKHSLETELVRLSLHSILHCLGYDHIKDEDYAVMHKVEMEVGKLCGYDFSE